MPHVHGAAINARIARIVFGAADPKAARADLCSTYAKRLNSTTTPP